MDVEGHCYVVHRNLRCKWLSVQVFLPHSMKVTGLIESYYGQWSSENVIRKRGKILKFCGIFKVWMVKRNSIQRRCGVTPYDPQGREWQVIVSVSIYFGFLLKFSVPPPQEKTNPWPQSQ